MKFGRAQVMVNYACLLFCCTCNVIKTFVFLVEERGDPHSYHKQRDFSLAVQLKLSQIRGSKV